MPLHIIRTCRHCGTAIEPADAEDLIVTAWIHTGLSIYCPGSGSRSIAAPILGVRPRVVPAPRFPTPQAGA